MEQNYRAVVMLLGEQNYFGLHPGTHDGQLVGRAAAGAGTRLRFPAKQAGIAARDGDSGTGTGRLGGPAEGRGESRSPAPSRRHTAARRCPATCRRTCRP